MIVVLIELACCAEEGMDNAQARKETKYTSLVSEINATNTLFTIEVSARGLVGVRPTKCLERLGCPPRGQMRSVNGSPRLSLGVPMPSTLPTAI